MEEVGEDEDEEVEEEEKRGRKGSKELVYRDERKGGLSLVHNMSHCLAMRCDAAPRSACDDL